MERGPASQALLAGVLFWNRKCIFRKYTHDKNSLTSY